MSLYGTDRQVDRQTDMTARTVMTSIAAVRMVVQ